MAKANPCPKCGGKSISCEPVFSKEEGSLFRFELGYHIACRNCGFKGETGRTLLEALDKWNRLAEQEGATA